MGNAAGVRHYFLEAFTPYGYISLLPEILREIKYTYLFAGEPGTGKSTMLKLIGIQLLDRGYDVDYIRSLKEPDSVAGLCLPKKRLCLLDEQEFTPDSLPAKEYCREIRFDSFCRKSRLEEHQDRIIELKKTLSEVEKEIIRQLKLDYFAESDQETSFISLKSFLGMEQKPNDYSTLNEAAEIISKIKKNCISYYFLQALQLDKWLNLAPRYVKDCDRICLDGGDSSDLLRDILQEVRFLGQVMEIIVHPLKPFSVIGIVFPEKKLAVWQGNPSRLEEQGFKKNSLELNKIIEEYRVVRIELRSRINDAVNFRDLDYLRCELLSSILSDLQEK